VLDDEEALIGDDTLAEIGDDMVTVGSVDPEEVDPLSLSCWALSGITNLAGGFGLSLGLGWTVAFWGGVGAERSGFFADGASSSWTGPLSRMNARIRWQKWMHNQGRFWGS
jgi:hypothetical protein